MSHYRARPAAAMTDAQIELDWREYQKDVTKLQVLQPTNS